MYTSPFLHSQIAGERQRGMLAQASQQRQARQARALARTFRPARRPHRIVHALLRPRAHASA